VNFIERAIIPFVTQKKMSRLFLLRSRAPSFFLAGNVEVRQSYGGRPEIMNAGKRNVPGEERRRVAASLEGEVGGAV
jgi:hypothetical protein